MDINLNIRSILGSIGVVAFLVLLIRIYLKNYNIELPFNVLLAATLILGFVISIAIYSITDLGLLVSFDIGYLISFIVLSLINPIGVIFVIILVILLVMIMGLS